MRIRNQSQLLNFTFDRFNEFNKYMKMPIPLLHNHQQMLLIMTSILVLLYELVGILTNR